MAPIIVQPPKGGVGASKQRGIVVQPKGAKGKKHGHHGVLGLVENLGSDVGHAVVGIPAGLVHTVEHPVGAAKAIAKTYRQTYGPLTHGDVGKFLHNLYEHPLGPILDVATVLTLGSGAAAKAGLLSSDAERLVLRSPAARAGQAEAKTLERLTSRNPAIRARQKLIHDALNRLPHDLPLLGETVRYGKELDRLPRQAALKARQALRDYNKAIRNLSNEEFAALHLIGRGVHPEDYARFLHGQPHVEPTMLKVLDNPKIHELVDHPSAHLDRAVEAARQLSQEDAKLKINRKLLAPETAEERVTRLANEVGGEKSAALRSRHEPFYVPDVPVQSRVANADFARMGGGVGVAKRPGSLKQNKGILARTGRLALHPDILGPEYLATIKYGLLDDIHSELMSSAVRVQRGTPLPEGWAYIRKKIISRTGNPRPQKIHALTQKQGAIERSLTELVGPEGEKVALGKDTFATLHESDAETLHGDYLIVPKKLTDQVAGEFHRGNKATRLFLEKPTKVWRALVLGFRVGFLTNNLVGNHLLYALHAAGIDGLRAYLNAVKREKGKGVVRSLLEDKQLPPALRQKFMDEFFPEQSQAGTFGQTQSPLLEKALPGKAARRAKRLGLGIAPVTQAVAETTLRRGLVETMIRKSPEFKRVYKAMPQQARDFEAAAREILGGTQPPQAGYVRLYRGEGHKTNRVRNAPAWMAANHGRWFTDDLAVAQKYAKSKAGTVRYVDLPESEATRFLVGNLDIGREFILPEHLVSNRRSFRPASPEYQRMISDKVNHALGDYLGLSDFERSTLRAAIPFYSWYKAITTITAHLALDTPGRANLLSKIGQLGAADTLNRLGTSKDYLAGLIPIGKARDGKQRVLSTGGLNPFQTDQQLIQGLAGLLAGKPGATGKAFSQLGPNPLLLAAIQNLSGKELFTGHDLKRGHGLPASVLQEIVRQLPQTQVTQALRGHGRPSKLYGKQSAREALLQYLGAPLKDLDLSAAQG